MGWDIHNWKSIRTHRIPIQGNANGKRFCPVEAMQPEWTCSLDLVY